MWRGVSHGREAGVRIGWENWDWLGALDLEGKMSGGMVVKKTPAVSCLSIRNKMGK